MKGRNLSIDSLNLKQPGNIVRKKNLHKQNHPPRRRGGRGDAWDADADKRHTLADEKAGNHHGIY